VAGDPWFVNGVIYAKSHTCMFTYDTQHKTKPKKLLGCGVSTPYILLCLICTITSELMYCPIFSNLSEPGSIFADFQWTGSVPAGFQEGFRAVLCGNFFSYTRDNYNMQIDK